MEQLAHQPPLPAVAGHEHQQDGTSGEREDRGHQYVQEGRSHLVPGRPSHRERGAIEQQQHRQQQQVLEQPQMRRGDDDPGIPGGCERIGGHSHEREVRPERNGDREDQPPGTGRLRFGGQVGHRALRQAIVSIGGPQPGSGRDG